MTDRRLLNWIFVAFTTYLENPAAWTRLLQRLRARVPVAPPGGEGEVSPLWVDVQKLRNMCVLSLSWNFFVSHDKYIARPSIYFDTQTIQPGLGDFVL